MKRTNTSTLNGRDLQKLPFDLMVTYRPTQQINFNAMENEIKYITKGIEYEYLYFSWERDRQTCKYHTHILIKTKQEKEQIYQSIYKQILGDNKTNNIRTGLRDVIVKTEKVYVNSLTQEKDVILKDQRVQVEFTEMHGRSGRVFIEPIIGNASVSYYTTKSTSRGLTMGYIQYGM